LKATEAGSPNGQAGGMGGMGGQSDRAAALNRQRRFLSALDPDTVLLDDFRELIDTAWRQSGARTTGTLGKREPNAPLRVLLLGYTGAGNTGADLRTIETIRQLRALFAGQSLELTVFALGGLLDHPDLRSVHLLSPGNDYLPDALAQAIPHYDVVLNVEGSTYTSKFSDALAALLIGGVGLAAANGRVACAYGIDAGAMTERLSRFAAATAEGVDIVCRSRGASERLRSLGLTVEEGADAAWNFRAADAARPMLPPRYAVLCPNNPFWWPVQTDVRRALELELAGASSALRYGPLSFHAWDDVRAAHFDAYKRGFAAVAEGLRRRGYAPVFVAMEQLDRAACEEIAALLPFDAPVLARGAYALDAIVGTLEQAQWIVTTRYHACVMAIANHVPVVGVSMDNRIDQLFAEHGLSDWALSCEERGFDRRVLDCIDAGVGPVLDDLRDRYAQIAQQQSHGFALMGERLKQRILTPTA
jgi:polysaccharide pyruvyl transferase WcaK-like protein